MTDPIRLERLHVYLNRSKMSDGEIIANPRFMPTGISKIADHMQIEDGDVMDMVSELAQHLSSLTEARDDEPRYSYEEDSLGGVTVRDSNTGDEKYLSVEQANKLMRALDGATGTEQDTLAKALKESVNYVPELSADEMGSEKSIFNFPWKLNESAGFAAAEYSGFGLNFRMKIVSVVDQNGDPVDSYDRKSLTKIARGYIDEA